MEVRENAASTSKDESFVFPTSYAQQRLWFLDRLEPGSTAYHLPLVVRLAGPLDARALARALSALVARHEALRTTFFESGGETFQAVGPARPVELKLVDLGGRGGAEAAALGLAAEEITRPFDLERGPLFRAALTRLGAEDHLLVLTLHHVVADGWSIGVLQRDLGELYAAALE